MLGRLVNQAIERHGFEYPWGELLPAVREADCFLINLECALTAHSAPWLDGQGKPFYFRAAPSVVQSLECARVRFACVANNHIADFGMEGLQDTIENLDRAGITHAGAGRDLASARAPAELTVNGARLRVLAYADYPQVWAAAETTPGIHYTSIHPGDERFVDVERAVKAARDEVDLLIVTAHWGPNMRARPTPSFRAFARALIDAGADIFWGHSAHVVQGVEIWKNKLILYDTGDFVDDYAVDEELRNDLSALFQVRVRPPVILGLDMLPVKISHMQVNRCDGEDREWFADRVRTLCSEMGTTVIDRDGVLSVTVTPADA